MIDTIPGTMTKGEAEKVARKWQKGQDEFPGPISEAPLPDTTHPVEHSDFYERRLERAQRREDYIRNGSG